jgi:hypothetical protein
LEPRGSLAAAYGISEACRSRDSQAQPGHASKHANATSHPVIASAEPGERWLYCYPDDAFTEY